MMFRFLLLIILVIFSLVACKVNPISVGAKNKLQHLSFVALENANKNMATAIDMVFIYDANVIDSLPKTAAEWFTKRESHLNQYSQQIAISSLEIAPLARVEQLPLPKHHSSAVAIFIYFNTLDGQTFMDLPVEDKCATITLAKQSVKYDSCH
jgi:hypothetical protein